jgi:WD40 repeat protein
MIGSFAGLTSNSVKNLTKSSGMSSTFCVLISYDWLISHAPGRYHSRAIRSLQFHPSYPLFASSSDDGSIQVFHARVYSDLLTDPIIVPLKILRGHDIREGLGVLQVKWVPKQPWLVSTGADSTISVWCH